MRCCPCFFFFIVENKRSVSLKGKKKETQEERKREESWEVGVAYKLLTFNLNQVGREKFSRAHRSKSSYKRGGRTRKRLLVRSGLELFVRLEFPVRSMTIVSKKMNVNM